VSGSSGGAASANLSIACEISTSIRLPYGSSVTSWNTVASLDSPRGAPRFA